METLFDVKEIFKFAYKYATRINRRYEIEFSRNEREWEKKWFGGAEYNLYFRTGDRGQNRRFVGWITIKEREDGKIDISADVQGRSGWEKTIEKDEIEKYVKQCISALHDINSNEWNNYWEDDSCIPITNDNVLNSLASHIY